MNYFLDAFTKKYADFDGRARRAEFWMFTLYHSLVILVLVMLFVFTALVAPKLALIPMAIYLMYGLASLLPSLAVQVRRLHDTDKSGWWLLLSFVPFGGLVLFVFSVTDSDPGRNQFGPNPKGVKRRAVRDDDDYEDDYDDRPRRRSRVRDDEDDDYEERPRRREQ